MVTVVTVILMVCKHRHHRHDRHGPRLCPVFRVKDRGRKDARLCPEKASQGRCGRDAAKPGSAGSPVSNWAGLHGANRKR